MRCLAYAALVLVLGIVSFAEPALAQSGKNYGSAICIKDTECPSHDSDVTQLVTQAANCVGRHFGFRADVFDMDRGIDYNDCVSTKGEQTFGSSPVAMAPHCCYEQTENGRCQLKCEVLAVR